MELDTITAWYMEVEDNKLTGGIAFKINQTSSAFLKGLNGTFSYS